jgi:hypothetical protein
VTTTTAARLRATVLLREAVPNLTLHAALGVVEFADVLLPDDLAVYRMLVPSTGKVLAHEITQTLTAGARR